jgi:hypothetical protein
MPHMADCIGFGAPSRHSRPRATRLWFTPDLMRHLASVPTQHQIDLQAGAGWVALPGALGKKYPNAGRG